eukprot:TRINITY_DN2_c0_g2_i1.p1 TRINITY_DN2_c0_g2~~TRINITY_DN2_c0_g2_i1.p1  ORF type:complete len:185 (-),score=27.04 TRINITY_DN2_c0_g2_i1:190-744(-)
MLSVQIRWRSCNAIVKSGTTKLDHKEQRKEEYVKTYKEKNRERLSLYHKNYALDNKEKVRKYNQSYETLNREIIREKRRRYRSDNPSVLMKDRVYKRKIREEKGFFKFNTSNNQLSVTWKRLYGKHIISSQLRSKYSTSFKQKKREEIFSMLREYGEGIKIGENGMYKSTRRLVFSFLLEISTN